MTQFDICNIALYRTGIRQQISNFTDATVQAQACALLYPIARDSLLRKAQWRFATLVDALLLFDAGTTYLVWDPTVTYLANARVMFGGQTFHARQGSTGQQPVPIGSGSDTDLYWEPGYNQNVIPGWQYTYQLKPPVQMLAPQYIFSGIRPGGIGFPNPNYLDYFGVTTVSQLPLINGAAPNIPFVWLSPYLYCDLPDAQLVYTKASTDPVADAWPELFSSALAWRLAVDLALGDAKKAGLARELGVQAAAALQEALAAESNNETPDWRPDSSFISIRD